METPCNPALQRSLSLLGGLLSLEFDLGITQHLQAPILSALHTAEAATQQALDNGKVTVLLGINIRVESPFTHVQLSLSTRGRAR
eukprot:6479760-Amphidinium_carterae.1